MEDGRTALALLSQGDFLAKVDLTDAYYSIPIDIESRKFLRFSFMVRLYQFNCLPFGASIGPLIFTKLRPVMQTLRTEGFRLVNFLDDFLCLGESREECLRNMQETTGLLVGLGFRINEEKTSRIPETQVTFLGISYNSVDMTLALPLQKRKVLQKIETLTRKTRCSIRELAQLIGLLNFCCLAIPYGRVYLKRLEKTRYLGLLANKQNFNAYIEIPAGSRQDLDWWSRQLPFQVSPIRPQTYSKEIFSDASDTGWGACCEGISVGGPWSKEEEQSHINSRELKAVFYGLRNFGSDLRDTSLLLRIDNTTAVAYVNKMGGVQYPWLNDIARAIWQFCEQRRLWLFASYIPSAENVLADKASRIKKTDTEWVLNREVFRQIIDRFGDPVIDLFASKDNRKCDSYVSWFPEPEAIAIDAFTLNWNRVGFFYAFPPFALILRTLRKIE